MQVRAFERYIPLIQTKMIYQIVLRFDCRFVDTPTHILMEE